jgi:hypothetical protein
VPTDPISVRWTHHALDKAQQLGFARLNVESALLDGHRGRWRNKGKAAWQVVAGRLVIAYEHPDGDDPFAARICGASLSADERTRTSTELPPHGPEPCASAKFRHIRRWMNRRYRTTPPVGLRSPVAGASGTVEAS